MKIKSQLVTEASGSIGGITASHNRGGMYFRGRVIPVNPGTPQQAVIRSHMSQLTSLWLNALTAAQRAAWDTYAENTYIPDALGEPRNIGGLGHYVRSNIPRLQAALARVDDAPTIWNLGDFTAPSITSFSEASQELTLAFNVGDDWVDEDEAAMLVYISRPRNASINYFKGPYRFADLIAGDSTTPPTSPATIAAPFPFVAGQRLFAKINVTRADGRYAATFRDFAAAGA